MRGVHWFAISVALVGGSAFTAGQGQPRQATAIQGPAGLISGTVTTGDAAPQPVRKAVLILSGATLNPSRSVLSDDEGRFALVGVPAGNYTLAAVKPGYVSTTYGEKQPGRGPGVVVSLVAGQRLDGLVMRLLRGAVITGRIHDDGGRLFPGLLVTVLESRVVNGERRIVTPALGPGAVLEPRAVTDDRGVYRIYGLPPGEYVVSATVSGVGGGSGPSADLRRVTALELQWAAAQVQGAGNGAGRGAAQPSPPPAGPRVGASALYYPGTPDPAIAQVLRLGAGEERTGVDFAVSFVPTARVEGAVAGPDGLPMGGVQLSLVRVGPATPASMSPGASSQADGSFSIANVPPGAYQLVARARGLSAGGRAAASPPVPTTALWALRDVTVSGRDVNGVSVQLQPGLRVTGRVAFESSTGAAPSPQTVAAARVNLVAVRGGPFPAVGVPSQSVSSDGTFEIAGIVPGRYRLTAAPGPGSAGWTHKASVLESRDLVDLSFEMTSANLDGVVVTLSDRPAGLAGKLLDTVGRPTPDYFVLAFATDRRYWQEGSRRLPAPVRPATDGTYRIGPLPAGTYYLAALTDITPEDRYDAAFLEQAATAALTITIGEGELKQQDLRLATAQ